MHRRHDTLRDLNTKLLRKAQEYVETEPHLLPVPVVEQETPQIGNMTEGVRLDIRAKGVWRPAQDAYFDVRVTNPFCATALKVPSSKICDEHEKREYNHIVMQIQQGTFAPLVYTTSNERVIALTGCPKI